MATPTTPDFGEKGISSHKDTVALLGSLLIRITSNLICKTDSDITRATIFPVDSKDGKCTLIRRLKMPVQGEEGKEAYQACVLLSSRASNARTGDIALFRMAEEDGITLPNAIFDWDMKGKVEIKNGTENVEIDLDSFYQVGQMMGFDIRAFPGRFRDPILHSSEVEVDGKWVSWNRTELAGQLAHSSITQADPILHFCPQGLYRGSMNTDVSRLGGVGRSLSRAISQVIYGVNWAPTQVAGGRGDILQLEGGGALCYQSSDTDLPFITEGQLPTSGIPSSGTLENYLKKLGSKKLDPSKFKKVGDGKPSNVGLSGIPAGIEIKSEGTLDYAMDMVMINIQSFKDFRFPQTIKTLKTTDRDLQALVLNLALYNTVCGRLDNLNIRSECSLIVDQPYESINVWQGSGHGQISSTIRITPEGIRKALLDSIKKTGIAKVWKDHQINIRPNQSLKVSKIKTLLNRLGADLDS